MRRALACLLLAGCAVGAPPGFSDGDLWTFPLVAPLEDDLLLVPVYVGDKKEPLLFMIDPDSPVSVIDSALQSELKPYAVQGPEVVNEADTRVRTFIAEILKLKVGDLEVRNLKVRIVHAGAWSSGGRVIRGVLGRDVIADSLILSVDRERGVAYLGTQGNLKPQPGAVEVGFRHFRNRQIAEVKVNGQSYDLHVDIGARTSMLWPDLMEKAKLPRVAVRAELVDELGTRREVKTGGMAAQVEAGAAKGGGILFLPFDDRRFEDDEFDGALGQNFLANFQMTFNWHQKKIWLKPRAADLVGTATERLRRWGNVFAGCATPACVKVVIVRDEAPAPPADPSTPTAAPGQVAAVKEIRIDREGQAASIPYEVTLEAVDADGQPLALPRVLAHLRGGIPTTSLRGLAAEYATAAAFVVLDVSPFPRPCDDAPGGEMCV
ncbi:MAG TPA: retropepsin-like aspartic protease, partial [Kofleriaceae bacterium]|nr:retropepsin-like aspartic protease [Kofleriaceae bacterium]